MADSTHLDAAYAQDLRVIEIPATELQARRQALHALYITHFPKLVGYFRRQGQPERVAHELAQDAFVNALKGLAGFKGHAKLSTWLWTVARNTLLAHVRTLRAAEDADDDTPIDPDGLSTDDPAHLTLQRDCVRRGFERFWADHPDRAEAVYLAIVEGWTREELAAYLGRTLHAATEYLSQCKQRLRPYLEGCSDD